LNVKFYVVFVFLSHIVGYPSPGVHCYSVMPIIIIIIPIMIHNWMQTVKKTQCALSLTAALDFSIDVTCMKPSLQGKERQWS
jgi:hypothetical protein